LGEKTKKRKEKEKEKPGMGFRRGKGVRALKTPDGR